MLEPETVRSMRLLASHGWGSKRIAKELEISRNTVRRYLKSGESAEKQVRPSSRRLDEGARKQAVRLFDGEAEKNPVVVHELLAKNGVHASVRTVQRAVEERRREVIAKEVATIRFETGPGMQMQIDFGEKVVEIGAAKVRVFLLVAVLSFSRRLFVKARPGRFVADAENVLVFGPPGVDKTHLAIAIGRAVVESGYAVLFTSATALIATLARAESEGQLAEKLAFFAKPKLLIVDELGYLPFEKPSAHLFFQLVARRYEKGSMLLTKNQLVSQWGTVFGDDVLAAAILDRLLHHSHTLVIQGESYRLKQKRKAGIFNSRTPSS